MGHCRRTRLRVREAKVQHHSKANDLWRRFEIAEWRKFCHQMKLRNRPAPHKPVASDIACRFIVFLRNFNAALGTLIYFGRGFLAAFLSLGRAL